jgi:hypothetical protein
VRICPVSIDYHVEVEAHYYSVPHRFVRAEGRHASTHERRPQARDRAGAHRIQSSALRRPDHRTHPQGCPAIGPATVALCNLILD